MAPIEGKCSCLCFMKKISFRMITDFDVTKQRQDNKDTDRYDTAFNPEGGQRPNPGVTAVTWLLQVLHLELRLE